MGGGGGGEYVRDSGARLNKMVGRGEGGGGGITLKLLGTDPSSTLASVPSLDYHHTILITIVGHWMWLYIYIYLEREKDRRIETYI